MKKLNVNLARKRLQDYHESKRKFKSQKCKQESTIFETMSISSKRTSTILKEKGNENNDLNLINDSVEVQLLEYEYVETNCQLESKHGRESPIILYINDSGLQLLNECTNEAYH